MKTLVAIAIVTAMILGSACLLPAEEPTPPSQPVHPGESPVPGSPPISSKGFPPALLGLLGAKSKAEAASPSAAPEPYPMFQLLGPSMTGNTGLTPEAMGTLLTMQGEMMMKMGEVLMKYGQMMSGKAN